MPTRLVSVILAAGLVLSVTEASAHAPDLAGEWTIAIDERFALCLLPAKE
jgi:hypothetical protein